MANNFDLINPGPENLENLRGAVDIMTAQMDQPLQMQFAMSRAREYINDLGAERVAEGLIMMSALLLVQIQRRGNVPPAAMLQSIAEIAAGSENNPPHPEGK